MESGAPCFEMQYECRIKGEEVQFFQTANIYNNIAHLLCDERWRTLSQKDKNEYIQDNLNYWFVHIRHEAGQSNECFAVGGIIFYHPLLNPKQRYQNPYTLCQMHTWLSEKREMLKIPFKLLDPPKSEENLLFQENKELVAV